jgi:hypothetical protein
MILTREQKKERNSMRSQNGARIRWGQLPRKPAAKNVPARSTSRLHQDYG